MKPIDLLIAFFVPISWGLGLVVAKPVVDGFPPILLMALRFSAAALALAWFVPIPRSQLPGLFWAALVGVTLQYGFTFYGLRHLDAGTSGLLVQTEAVFLVLLAAIFLGEPFGLRQVVGMAIAFLGLWMISGEPRLEGKGFGVALLLTGTVFWASGQILIRRLGKVDGLTTVAWVAIISSPQLYLLSFLVEGNPVPAITSADLGVWGAALYMGLIMTGIGYACWYHVLGRYPAALTSPFLLLTPVSAVIGGWLFLGEPLSWNFLLGGAIVTVGVAVLLLERRQRQ
ncbi:MAG: DMT family transporter [Pseudomonadota bacterium]